MKTRDSILSPASSKAPSGKAERAFQPPAVG